MTGAAAAGIVTLALLGLLFGGVAWLFTRDWPWVQLVDDWLDNLLDPPARTDRWHRRRAWWRRHSLEVAAAAAILLVGFAAGRTTAPTPALAAPQVTVQTPATPAAPPPKSARASTSEWDWWLNVLQVERLYDPDHPPGTSTPESLAAEWCAVFDTAISLDQVVEAIATSSPQPDLDARLAAAANQLVCTRDRR